MSKLKNKLSIGILSWNRPEILEQTLSSYKKNGLLSFSDDITIFFNEISEKDKKIVKKYNIKYLSSDVNIGIQGGIRALVNKAKNEYFLFLENDWLLIENITKTKEIILNGIELLEQNKIDVLRLRHSKKPGQPCITQKLYKNSPQNIPQDSLVNSILICEDPTVYFKDQIKLEVVNNQKFYVFDSSNAQYTNNPCLYKTSFYKKIINQDYKKNSYIDLTDYATMKNTTLCNISLEADIIPYWSKQGFKIAVAGGLFTHKDVKITFFQKKKEGNRRIFYILGKKVLSYRKKQSKYDKIYAKRFKGLTRDEERYILETQFERMAGYKLNLDNPQSFNEKIQWLKHNYRDPLMTKCADKVGVREYVKEKIGEEYLVPIIGIYDSVDDIDFDKLPDKFVAKVNWGSGQNIIVPDKSKLDINEAKEKLKKWMQPESNHYYNFLEWVYKDIEPKIIVEEFLDGVDDLIDYKYLCYNSEPKNMFMVQNRACGKDKMRINFFDANFNPLPFIREYKSSKESIAKPNMWDEMLRISKILAEPFPFVRVDFYMINGQLKIGELTFSPGNGTERFEPREWDYKLGELLDLPINEKQKGSNPVVITLSGGG